MLARCTCVRGDWQDDVTILSLSFKVKAVCAVLGIRFITNRCLGLLTFDCLLLFAV